MDKPLPAGWRRVRLGEVCELIRGVSFDKSAVNTIYFSGSVPILRAGNIGESLIIDKDLIWIPREYISQQQYLQIGDIVICISSGSPSVVGKSAINENDFLASVGAFCGIIRPINDILAKYLSYWMRSEDFIIWRDLQARGANIQNLRFSEIFKISIPLPPLDEQQRIVAILNEKMAAVQQARRAAEEQLRAVQALPAAYLRQAFPQPGQPLPAGWRRVRLGEVCCADRVIIDPTSPDANNLPFLGLEHIESETGIILLDPEDLPHTALSTTFLFDTRHVLYGKLRPYLNKVAIPNFSGKCSTELCPFINKRERYYLAWFTSSEL